MTSTTQSTSPIFRATASATPGPDADELALIMEAHAGSWTAAPVGPGSDVQVEVKGERARIVYGKRRIDGELSGGSRRYVISGEPGYLVKVKRRGSHIDLRDSRGEMRCQARIVGDSVRLLIPGVKPTHYFIAAHGEGSYQLSREGKPAGSVAFDARSATVLVRDAGGSARFEGTATASSALWAALLIAELDQPLRYVLMAEIGARGR